MAKKRDFYVEKNQVFSVHSKTYVEYFGKREDVLTNSASIKKNFSNLLF